MAVQSKEENKLRPDLPNDYEVWQDGDDFWLVAFMELPEGDTFVWRYLIEDPASILDKTVVSLVPNVIISDGVIVEQAEDSVVSDVMYNSSFNFGTTNQLSVVSEYVEDGAESYEYLVEAIKQESRFAPWLLSTDENGNYDYLAVAIEAAQEGRVPRDKELMTTSWYRDKTSGVRKAIKSKAEDPETWLQDWDKSFESIATQLLSSGIQTLNPDLINEITNSFMMGEYGEGDSAVAEINKIISKIRNRKLPYELPERIEAIIEGKPLEIIQATSGVKDDIESIMGPGSSLNFNLEDVANQREANPLWYDEEFIPGLEESFVAKFPQYKNTNVKRYSTASPQWRYEWNNLVGQSPDEQSASWTRFISTNDIKEREDIAFEVSAELGTQTFKDKAEEDLESVFGQPGQRVTGGTKWNRRVK